MAVARMLARIAIRNLLAARRRTGLLGSAIGIVTALLVVLLSISHGIEDNLVHMATTLNSGHVVVGGFYKVTPGSGGPVVTEMSTLRTFLEENIDGVEMILDRHRGWAKVVSETGSSQSGVGGIDLADESRLVGALQLAQEQEYFDGGRAQAVGDLSGLAEPHTILLFASQAKKLGVRVGDVVTLQTETVGGMTNTIDVTIVAIAQDLGLMSNWVVFLPKSDLVELYSLAEDTTGALHIYLDDIERAPAVMRQLRSDLAAAGYRVMEHRPMPFWMKFETVNGEDWTGQKLDVTTWRDEVAYLTWVLTAFDSVAWFLVVILVAIIGVGIMNAMWNAVRERTAEIGTLRAIGMTRRRVMAMVMFEALFLGLGATVLGGGIGSALALAVDAAEFPIPIEAMKAILLTDVVHLAPSSLAMLAAVVTITGFTALAALLPAARAARMRPITAITHTE